MGHIQRLWATLGGLWASFQWGIVAFDFWLLGFPGVALQEQRQGLYRLTLVYEALKVYGGFCKLGDGPSKGVGVPVKGL